MCHDKIMWSAVCLLAPHLHFGTLAIMSQKLLYSLCICKRKGRKLMPNLLLTLRTTF